MATQDTTFVPNSTAFSAQMAQALNDSVWKGRNPVYTTSTGTSTAYVVTLPSPSLATTLVAGDSFTWKVHVTNTGPATLTIMGNSSLGTIQLTNGITALTTGQLVGGTVVTTVYDGTKFQALIDTVGSGGGGTTPKKIVVLGDSLSYQGAERMLSWPSLLTKSLQSMGSNVSVVNLAVSGHSFYRANTVASFGANTAIQQCIDLAPELVLVMLGANDALIQVDSRSLAQIKSDATTAINALRSALPSTKIIYISEQCYDASKFSVTSIKNKGVIPALCSLNAGGVLAGSYCPEMLDNYLDVAQQSMFTNWGSFDTYLRALGFDGVITMNLFTPARLGCTMPDGLHPSSEGLMIIHAQILKGLSTQAAAVGVVPQLTNFTNNITDGALQIFSTVLTTSGDGYISNVSPGNVTGEKFALEAIMLRSLDPDFWYYPYKTSLWVTPLSGSITASTPIIFVLDNAPPNSQVSLSFNGSAFSLLSITTDHKGRMWFPNDYNLLGVAAGTYTLRYKVGNSISVGIPVTVNS